MGFFDNINGAIKTYPIHNAEEFIRKIESFLPNNISYNPGDIIQFSQKFGIDIIHTYYENLKIINHENNNDEAGFSFSCWHSIHANIELKSLIPTIIVNYDDYLKEQLSPDKHPPIMNVVRCDDYDSLSNKIVNSKCTACKCDFRNKNTTSPTSICKTLHCDRCMFTSLVRKE